MSVSNLTKKEKKLITEAENWWSGVSQIQKRDMCVNTFGSPDFLCLSEINIYTIYSKYINKKTNGNSSKQK